MFADRHLYTNIYIQIYIYNIYGKLMYEEILTPLTLSYGGLNPKATQLASGPLYTPRVTVYESMITRVMLCNSSFILEYFITMTYFSHINTACYSLCVFNGQSRAGLTCQEAWGPPYGGWPFFPLILCSPQNYYVDTGYILGQTSSSQL